MAWMKRVSQGGVEKQNVFCYNLNFLRPRAQLHVQRLQPLLEENRQSFLAPKAVTQVPKVQAFSEVLGYGPP